MGVLVSTCNRGFRVEAWVCKAEEYDLSVNRSLAVEEFAFLNQDLDCESSEPSWARLRCGVYDVGFGLQALLGCAPNRACGLGCAVPCASVPAAMENP